MADCTVQLCVTLLAAPSDMPGSVCKEGVTYWCGNALP